MFCVCSILCFCLCSTQLYIQMNDVKNLFAGTLYKIRFVDRKLSKSGHTVQAETQRPVG